MASCQCLLTPLQVTFVSSGSPGSPPGQGSFERRGSPCTAGGER